MNREQRTGPGWLHLKAIHTVHLCASLHSRFSSFIRAHKLKLLAASVVSLVCLCIGLLFINRSLPAVQPARNSSHTNKTRMVGRSEFVESDNAALKRLCELNDKHSGEMPYSVEDLKRNDKAAWQQVDQGIQNATRLLPLARQLTLESLTELAHSYHIREDELRKAEHHINGVRSILLDESLDNTAEVDDESPSEIRIGPDYALYLTSDEEVILLLGHELTHVAAWDDNLQQFFLAVKTETTRRANVYPTDEQQEDLACDFIGEQALKHFVRLHPSMRTTAERLSIALGDDCTPDEADPNSDEEHLSQSETLHALLGLDPELSHLILSK